MPKYCQKKYIRNVYKIKYYCQLNKYCFVKRNLKEFIISLYRQSVDKINQNRIYLTLFVDLSLANFSSP